MDYIFVYFLLLAYHKYTRLIDEGLMYCSKNSACCVSNVLFNKLNLFELREFGCIWSVITSLLGDWRVDKLLAFKGKGLMQMFYM